MKKITAIFVLVSIVVLISNGLSAQKAKGIFKALESFHAERYEDASKEFEMFLPSVEKRYGAADTNYYSVILYYAAISFEQLQKYDKSEYYYLKSLGIYASIDGGNQSPTYLNVLHGLAYLYQVTGRYDEALPLFREVKRIREITLGVHHPYYATICNNIAGLYEDMGDYQTAEYYYNKALTLLEDLYGKEHPNYLSGCVNLALLYQSTGNYKRSETLYLETKAIQEKLLGTDNTAWATTCNNLGLLYSDLGNYAKAEKLFVESKTLNEKFLGKTHPNYATDCDNLAMLYKARGYAITDNKEKQEDFTKADVLFTESLNIRRTIFGNKHPEYAASCNNLAGLYEMMGSTASDKNIAAEYFEKAESLYLEAKEITEESLGKEHPKYAISCSNLGALYLSFGYYDNAEKILLESKSTLEEKFGKNNPTYALSCINLASMYRIRGLSVENMAQKEQDFTTAESLYLESVEIANNNMRQNFGFLSEKEQEMYFKTLSLHYSTFNSFCLERNEQNPAIADHVYNNTVQNKGLLLKSNTALRSSILNSNDKDLIADYNNWTEVKRELSQLYAMPARSRTKDPRVLEEEANRIEKELVKRSSVFRDFVNSISIKFDNVKESLKSGEAAIEFVRFKKYWTDTVLYCALIVRPDQEHTMMVQLFTENQMDQLLGKFAGNNYNYISDIYGKKGEYNSALYDLIWKPMDELLKGIQTVYVSPAGLLHKVSFAAINNGQSVFLCDKFDIRIQSSTAKIVNPESLDLSGNITATLFGGVDYNSDSTQNEIWKYLQGTKDETENIDSILNKNNIQRSYFTSYNATETKFKELAQQSDLMHISTHGFFYPDPAEVRRTLLADKSKDGQDTHQNSSSENRASGNGRYGFGVYAFVLQDNPLMRSGLVMAGANDVWTPGSKSPENKDDGVLTAEEVAQLNMRKTQLVVLSACETGLGDIKGSEGVYGLQRAFKMAGVKFIIMSLWKVADKETEEFMSLLYTELFKSKNVRESFNKAQKEMRKKYDPYFWAAFELVE